MQRRGGRDKVIEGEKESYIKPGLGGAWAET